MPESTLVAADTNVLIDYARAEDTVVDCFETIHRRVASAGVLVLPTVIHELADLADQGDTEAVRAAARKALGSILHPWGLQPVNCVPVGHGIVEQVALKLRRRGLIPDSEVNDSYVVAEAGLIGVTLLVSNDTHLKDINHAALKLEMEAADLTAPLIVSPWKIVHEFFR